MESSRHNKRQKTSVSDSPTTEGNIFGTTEAICKTIIPSKNKGLDTKLTTEMTEKKAVSETKIPTHDQNDKSKGKSTDDGIYFSFKTYNSQFDDDHKKCGQLPKLIENVMFRKKNISRALNYENHVDLHIFLLAARSIHHFNYDEIENVLPAHPIFIGTDSGLIQYISDSAEFITLPEKLVAEYNVPIAFLIPDKEMRHFVCAKICFKKSGDNNDATIEVEIYDSAYCPKDSNIDSLECEPDERLQFMPYTNVSEEEEYYSSFVRKGIISQLWNVRKTKSEEDKMVDESNGQGEEAENASLHDTHCKQYKCAEDLKFQITLKNSVLIPSSGKDRTCGITSTLCLLLLMTGHDPSTCGIKFSEYFDDVPQFHKSMMSLFLLSIHKFFEDIANVEYGTIEDFSDENGSIMDSVNETGNDQTLNTVMSCQKNKECLEIIQKEFSSVNVNWSKALGDKLFGLFSFLELK